MHKPAPVFPENPERPGAYPVLRDNFETPIPVYDIIHFLEVQKYLVEDRLSHGCEVLYQLGLEGGGPRSTAHLKLM